MVFVNTDIGLVCEVIMLVPLPGSLVGGGGMVEYEPTPKDKMKRHDLFGVRICATNIHISGN